jgi:hypothetical protein
VVAGDWMLALLGGERSPYVLLDESNELSVIAEDERLVWRAELPAFESDLVASPQDAGAALLARYERWIDRGPESLRKLALAALLDSEAPFAPLDAEFARRRVERALDPEADTSARLGSAFAATLARGGADRLLEALEGAEAVDPDVAVVALQGGLRAGSPHTQSALARLLEHGSPRVRSRALEMAPAVDRDRRLHGRVGALAASDPDARVRRSAESALRRYGAEDAAR